MSKDPGPTIHIGVVYMVTNLEKKEFRIHMVCFLILSQRITLTENITSSCKSRAGCRHYQSHEIRVGFFSNINSKTETVTEVGHVACGPLRTSDALISAALIFLGSNRFPVSFHCTPANSWIVWTILSKIDTVNFAYC